MNTRFDCALNSVSLSSLHDSIVILDIIEDAPRMNTSALPLFSCGQHVLSSSRQSISVQVRFAIHEEIPVRRRAVMQDIHAWAFQGGKLTITPRPGQRLNVSCTGLPALSFQDWPEEMRITFTSTYSPWWEDAEPITISGTGTQTLLVPGTAAYADIDIVILNSSDHEITSFTVRCGSNRMTFQNIFLPVGGQLVLSHVNGCFVAKQNGSSILHRRTADSSDDLLPPCGNSSDFSVTANYPLYAYFQVRGRYA